MPTHRMPGEIYPVGIDGEGGLGDIEDFERIQTRVPRYDLARRFPNEELVVHARLEAGGVELASAIVPLPGRLERSGEKPLVMRLNLRAGGSDDDDDDDEDDDDDDPSTVAGVPARTRVNARTLP